MTNSTPPSSTQDILEEVAEQVVDLCHTHDHLTRIIRNVELDEDWFNGYDEPGKAEFDLLPMVRTFLYKRIRDIEGEKELAERLSGAAFLHIRFRFNVKEPPQKATLNYNKWHRFDIEDRNLLSNLADCIEEICDEYDIIESHAPALDPDDLDGAHLSEEQIIKAVERASRLGFGEFTANRASNASYALEAYLERQGYLNMAKAGTTTKRRRFARMSKRGEVPHGSSHNRTMKKIADPGSQLTFDEFVNGSPVPDWKRIRDELLDPFHVGIENILEELTESKEFSERAFREPVHAAIDITTWEFHASPYMSAEQILEADRDPIWIEVNGTEKPLDPEHPEMVSGFNDKGDRAYKFATISIVAEDTPIVLGIEPVRDQRNWEAENDRDVETTSRGEVVERLIEQASQHVDIHKVFLDRGFDSAEVRDVIDRVESTYVLGKAKKADVDEENIEEIKEDELHDTRIALGTLEHEGRTHDISYVYKPTDEEEEDYAIFTINDHVDPGRAEALIGQYAQRIEIENEYKSIKQNFLPKCASKDYRMRFLYFLVGVMMFNCWRLTNFLLRDEVDGNLGESPPVPAGELIELVAFCLFDPGG